MEGEIVNLKSQLIPEGNLETNCILKRNKKQGYQP